MKQPEDGSMSIDVTQQHQLGSNKTIFILLYVERIIEGKPGF
jgi:hypothetical protein